MKRTEIPVYEMDSKRRFSVYEVTIKKESLLDKILDFMFGEQE